MKQYVHSFYTTNDFTTFTNSNNYHEPFVSDTFETNKVNYNLRKKLVFNILTNGYINWKCSDDSVSKRLYYIINDGQENYISSSTSGNKINVSAGDTVTIWSDTFTCSESLSKYNTFEGTTCNFSVEGNLNALINTLSKTSLDNKNYIYANLFKNCTTLKSIQKIYLPVKDFAEGSFYQTFYGCTGIENNVFPLTIISCKEQTFYQTFYNCSSLSNSNNFTLNLNEVPTSCFEETFYGCSSLTTIPKIKIINLGESSFKGLFKNCTSLQEIDNIQIDKLSTSCFEEMFYGCTSLSNINFDLNSGYVYDSSYKRMFYGCSSLQESPDIRVLYIDEEVTEDPFYEMFYNCSSLNTIHISSYDGETTGLFTSWVKNVSSTGTFYKNEDNSNWTIGINGIPTGWTSREENYEELPLTFLFLEDGKFTINTNNIKGLNKLLYKLNSNEIKEIDINKSQVISVNCGDKIQLFGNSEFADTYNQVQKFSSTSNCKIYGNLLSLSYSQTFYIHYLNNEPSILSFYYLFYNFNKLISAKNLIFPDTIDSRNSYSYIFYNCTNLQYSPKILPALNLNEVSYSCMFDGCSSLLTIPLLPATILSNSCYYRMFYNCSSLTSLPSNFTLPATTLADHCYDEMFYGSRSLASLPSNFTLLATTLNTYCYYSMFYNCSSLASLPNNFTLPATTLADSCYRCMFYNCSSLASLPNNFTLPATTLTYYCYGGMFTNCSSLTSLPNNFTLPADTLANYCYSGMFRDCGLTSLPNDFTLSSTNLSYSCYSGMFENCSRLASLPTNFTLPSITLQGYCYNNMFSGCSSLTALPSNFTLSATTLAESCYYGMFSGCSSLTSLPSNFTLSATTLQSSCYRSMFASCSSLSSLPTNFTLPSTTLANYCYQSMFSNCSSLSSLPTNFTLPSTTLTSQCYYEMFSGCSNLILPNNFILPAPNLVYYGYYRMFYNCSKINKLICLAKSNINLSYSTSNWLSGVSSSGIFYKDINSDWPRSESGIPSGWTIYPYLDNSNTYVLKGNNIFNITKNSITISGVTIYYKNSCTYQIENSLSWISNIETIDSTNIGNNNFSSISMSFDISGNNTSSNRSGSFSINFYNNSTLIDTLQIVINQSVEEESCEVILLPSGSSYGWQDSNLRGPNGEIIYYSANNGSASSTAKMQIRLSEYNEFTIKVATNGESSYDYVIVSELDATPTSSSSIHGSTGNEWSGSGKTSSKSSVSSYNTLTWYTVSYSNITTSSHIITIIYIKDSSVDKFTDRGYIYIPS